MEESLIAGVPAQIKINGADFTLSPLTIGDFEEYEKWCEDRSIAQLKKTLATMASEGIIDQSIRSKIVSETHDAINNGISMARATRTFSGYSMLLWLSLRHKHPTIDLIWIKSNVGLNSRADIEDKIDELSGLKAKPTPGETVPAMSA